ncbi:MAG TPA: CBS domain-containing protein, partial [Crenalkalicoccus sp.]|nr:CBS domain-containing protein [Crenalkalicoccus sp.]
ARHGGEAVQEGTHGAAEVLRRGAEAGRRGGEAFGEVARQGVSAAAAGQQRILQTAAQELEQTGRRLAEVAQETAQNMRELMTMPHMQGDSLREAQQALAQLVDGVVTTNMRLMQEMMRRSGPSSIVELQQRFIREYFDALAEGGTVLLRATRRAAEEALRPLEQQANRRASGGGRAQPNGRYQQQDGRVADVMSRNVRTIGPDDTVQQAARIMAEEDTGALPVREGDRLIGMLTDRDIAVRVAAEGRDPARTKVRDVMTPDVRYVFEDEPIRHVAENMAEQQVRRLPVVNRDKRLVGIVSLGDIAGEHGEAAGQALSGVARESGQHRQQLGA